MEKVKSEGIALNEKESPKVKSGFSCPQFSKQVLIPTNKWNDKNGAEFFKSEVVETSAGTKYEPLFYTGELVSAHKEGKVSLPLFINGGKLNPAIRWNNTRNGLVIAQD